MAGGDTWPTSPRRLGLVWAAARRASRCGRACRVRRRAPGSEAEVRRLRAAASSSSSTPP
eukprot:506052-Prorocentrum_minimum.AAC.1